MMDFPFEFPLKSTKWGFPEKRDEPPISLFNLLDDWAVLRYAKTVELVG